MIRAIVCFALLATVATVVAIVPPLNNDTIVDLHMVLPYQVASAVCAAQGAHATYVAMPLQNMTGNELCALEKYGNRKCVAGKYLVVYVDLDHTGSVERDMNCTSVPDRMWWPWGTEAMGVPTTASTEWVRRTYVLCCA